MRYNEEDELERMRSRRGRRREASYEDDYEDYDDFPAEDLEEVYIDDRSSGRGGRPARRTNQQAFRTDSVRDYEYRQTSRQTGSQRGAGRPPRRGQEPSSSRQGQRAVNRDPPWTRFSAVTVPPRLLTVSLTMERPRPVPPAARERALSTR